MKKIISLLFGSIVGIIVTALLLGMFFVMPLEFVISGLHIYRVSSQTEGEVLSAESKAEKGNTRSFITYQYRVDGEIFLSDRVRAGWISDSSYEHQAGDLAKSLKVGDAVSVHYDSHDPGFSLLQYGWPKWSIGFSLAVWGIFLRDHLSKKSSSQKVFLYGLAHSMILSGAGVIFLLPLTVSPKLLIWTLLSWLGLTILISGSRLIWLRFGK